MNDQTKKSQDVIDEDKTVANNVVIGSLSEVMFVGLPLLVLTIVFFCNKRGCDIMSSPEWSFAAAILFGQGIVKVVGALSEKGGMHGERVAFICTVILVLGLVPSLVVLSLMLLADRDRPSSDLVALQEILFALALLAFAFCTSLVAGAKARSKKEA